MLNSQRSFVDAVKKYCAAHEIAVEVRAQGWLMVMQKGSKRRFAYGYDLGLNGAVTHRIANDKAATAEILGHAGIAHVPHTLFLSPHLSEFVPQPGSWEAMLGILQDNPGGIVVKPNEGTSGNHVFKVRSRAKLERAVNRIFALEQNVAISPYLAIADEVRVILIDDRPLVVYSKQRPSVTGDGVHSLLELAASTMPTERLRAVQAGIAEDPDQVPLETILPSGRRHVLSWRHNLDSGAEPVLLEQGAVLESCVRIAITAAKSIGLRFGSVDVVQVDGVQRILEINSGVMMEGLSRRHPDLVQVAYSAALDRVFE
jgi:glutathione synthase/RimK-type ligase-like ATP-grasp enzyme